MEATPMLPEFLAAIADSDPVTWVLLYLIFREVRRPPATASPSPAGDQEGG